MWHTGQPAFVKIAVIGSSPVTNDTISGVSATGDETGTGVTGEGVRERRANTVPSNSVTTMSGVIDRSAIEPVTETAWASCHATQRHRRLSLPLSHTADTLGPAPTGDVTPLVKGPAGINTIGAPSKPYLGPTDGTPGPTFECCGSAAPGQIAPVITLIPAHRIVYCLRMAFSIAGQCIQH